MSNKAGLAPGEVQAPLYVSQTTARVLPATTTLYQFSVVGMIVIRGWYGLITTACSGTATTLTGVWDPTLTGSNVSLTTATAVASLAAGVIVSYQGGTTVVAWQVGFTATSNVGVSHEANPGSTVVCGGRLGLTTSATNTGVLRWYLAWQPIDRAATVAIINAA